MTDRPCHLAAARRSPPRSTPRSLASPVTVSCTLRGVAGGQGRRDLRSAGQQAFTHRQGGGDNLKVFEALLRQVQLLLTLLVSEPASASKTGGLTLASRRTAPGETRKGLLWGRRHQIASPRVGRKAKDNLLMPEGLDGSARGQGHGQMVDM